MPGPKTIEEAKALPEMSLAERVEAGFGAEPISGDDIVAFVDDDGVPKQVECTAKGWVKIP